MILTDKRRYLRNLIGPYDKGGITSYLSSPCSDEFTCKTNIAIIVDNREDDVDGGWIVGWLGGWVSHIFLSELWKYSPFVILRNEGSASVLSKQIPPLSE